jgi:short-subunit dehydrogenase
MSTKRALITGASSGIGEALAHRLAREGMDLVLVARRQAELERVARALGAGVRVELVSADLARPEAPAMVLERLGERGVDVLVNNAGAGWVGEFASAPLARQLELVDLNVRALVELTHRALPAMLARRSGHVVQVASVAGFLPGPLASVYYASKAFVVSHSEALRHELEGTGVSITLSCPGPVATEFQRASGVKGRVGERAAMSARDVADATADAMLARRFLVVPGAPNLALVALSRVVPNRVLAGLVSRMQAARLRG